MGNFTENKDSHIAIGTPEYYQEEQREADTKVRVDETVVHAQIDGDQNA